MSEYSSSINIGDARSSWTESDVRTFSLPAARLDAIVRDAMHAVTGVEPERQGETWCCVLPPTKSVFDLRSLAVVVRARDDGSEVETTMTFDASGDRLAATMWLFITIIGIPVGLAWRGISIRNARRFARQTFDALWKKIEESERVIYR